jgi:hydroxylamine dehydrogenase
VANGIMARLRAAGRRARMGAAMVGADHVQWKGFFEVAQRFNNEILPEAERLHPGVADDILQRPEHRWYKTASFTPELLEQILKTNLQTWKA